VFQRRTEERRERERKGMEKNMTYSGEVEIVEHSTTCLPYCGTAVLLLTFA
jgi:hypothetical protein